MLFSVEQAFVGRDEKRVPLKTPAWEAMLQLFRRKKENSETDLFLFCLVEACCRRKLAMPKHK